ncbi:ANTAR domain-containing protein [Streptomyces sp. R41]|uniref:ANTAR domain-containing protein n=1 Tax=Streptomyces sp. R41 TaxID=3238632 RepID=A0AB39RVW1_9ACTN
MEELQDANAQLYEAIRSHAVVDQAMGVVLAIGQLTPEQGWAVLKDVSQQTNIKLRHVPELVIEWARTGALCTDIRSELERQVA